MTALDRTGQRTLRAYGGWLLAQIVADPDAGISHAKGSQWGASDYGPDQLRMQTTVRGIELREEYGSPPVQVLTWTCVRQYVRTLPAALREQVREAAAAVARHHAEYPAWAASPAAQGCGRGPAIGPLTAVQQLYADEQDAWQQDRYLPWRAAHLALEQARERLLDQCFPLALDTAEPTDLLELLAVTA